MLTVDDAIRTDLRASQRDAFVVDCVRRLKAQDPFHTDAAGDAAVEAMVRLGLTRARVYGITGTSSVTLYVQLMLLLGSYFDVDPMYPWAKAQLTNPADGDTQPDTMNHLRAKMLKFVTQTSGPKGELAQVFLARVDAFLSAKLDGADTTPKAVQDALRDLCPERVAYMGEDAFRQVTLHAIARAQTARITEFQPTVAIALLCTVYGMHVFDDPLHHWSRAVLRKCETHADPDALVVKASTRFFARTRAHLTARTQ